MNILWLTTRGLNGWRQKCSHFPINKFIHGKHIVYLFIYLLSMDYFHYFFNISVDQRNLYDINWKQIAEKTDVALKVQTILVFICAFSRPRLDRLFFVSNLNLIKESFCAHVCMFAPLRATYCKENAKFNFWTVSHQVPGRLGRKFWYLFFFNSHCDFFAIFSLWTDNSML